MFFAYKKLLGRTETRTRDRMYLGRIRSVRDISRDARAKIATCSLRTPTDRQTYGELAGIPVKGKSSACLICMKYRIIILIIIISLGQIFYRIANTSRMHTGTRRPSTYMHAPTYMHARTCVRTHTYTHARTLAHTHARTHVHTHSRRRRHRLPHRLSLFIGAQP